MRRGPWLTLIITAVILGALFVPAATVPDVGIDHMDFAVHVVLFGGWMAAAASEFPRVRLGWLALVAGALALGTESLQHLSPGRTFSVLDLLADAVGVLLVAGIAAVIRRGKSGAARVG